MSNYSLPASDDRPLSATLDDPVKLSEGNRSSPTESDDLMAPSQGTSLFADRNDDIIDLGGAVGG